MGRLPASLLALLVLTVSTRLVSQQQPRPVFTDRVDLVRVDVSVLDRNRRPVSGLTAADFTIQEDGRLQEIAAFAEISLPDPETFPADWMREVSADVRLNDDTSDYRLLVLVLDDATLPQQPVVIRAAKQAASGVIDRLGPRDLAAVVFTANNRHAQNFSNERARLHSAIETLNPWGLAMGPEMSLRTMTEIAKYLVSVPDRRKTIVYVGSGFVMEDTATRFGTPILDGVRNTIRAAAQANANIYCINPEGLTVTRNSASDKRAFSLRALSDNTGGRAFPASNEFVSQAPQILRESGGFYLLAYSPANTRADGRFRRLQVRVNRPGLTVKTKAGYYEPDRNARPLPELPAATAAALAGLLPKSDLPLRATAAPFAAPGRDSAIIAIVMGLPPGRAEDSAGDEVQIEVRAFTPDGSARGTPQRMIARVARRAAAPAEVGGEVLAGVDLGPGRYELRLAAVSTAQKESGSVYYDVEVPDFRAAVAVWGRAERRAASTGGTP